MSDRQQSECCSPSGSVPALEELDARCPVRRGSWRPGLSRWDILMVISVISLGILLLFPHLFNSRVRARRRLCEYRQMSLGRALLRYETHFGEFPGYRDTLNPLAEDSPAIGWSYAILPYIGVAYDSDKADYSAKEDIRLGPWAKIHEQYGPAAEIKEQLPVSAIYIPHLVCPDDLPPGLDRNKQTVAWCSYVVNGGLPDAKRADVADSFPVDWPANGMFLDGLNRRHPALGKVTLESIQQADGAAGTLMLSENLDSGLWTDALEFQTTFLWVANSREGNADPGNQLLRLNQRGGEGQGSGKLLFARPSSRHRGGVNVVYADGHTEFLSDQIDYAVYAYKMAADNQKLRRPGSDQRIGPPYHREDPLLEEETASESAEGQ